MTTRALSFDTAADRYAANRPSYPPHLFDAVEALAGRALAGARLADVGAGTGLATASLHARGARVVAVEPGAAMAARLRRDLPAVPLLRGDGNRLPLASGSQDVLTYAQSWHWTDPAAAAAEARRVLRPGGALALWWNHFDTSHAWLADQDARTTRFLGAGDGAGHDARLPTDDLPADLRPVRRRLRWSRRVSLDTHLANLGSHSAFLVRGDDGRAFLAEERARLARLFPQGTVEEHYVVHLSVART